MVAYNTLFRLDSGRNLFSKTKLNVNNKDILDTTITTINANYLEDFGIGFIRDENVVFESLEELYRTISRLQLGLENNTEEISLDYYVIVGNVSKLKRYDDVIVTNCCVNTLKIRLKHNSRFSVTDKDLLITNLLTIFNYLMVKDVSGKKHLNNILKEYNKSTGE